MSLASPSESGVPPQPQPEPVVTHDFGFGSSVHDDARLLLGASNWRAAEVFNVYSAGDSGEGCEVIEFTMPSASGRVPWTAKVLLSDGERCVICSRGWA